MCATLVTCISDSNISCMFSTLISCVHFMEEYMLALLDNALNLPFSRPLPSKLLQYIFVSCVQKIPCPFDFVIPCDVLIHRLELLIYWLSKVPMI